MVAKSAKIYLYNKDEWKNKMVSACVWIAKTIRKDEIGKMARRGSA
jgi:hypothetical protein